MLRLRRQQLPSLKALLRLRRRLRCHHRPPLKPRPPTPVNVPVTISQVQMMNDRNGWGIGVPLGEANPALLRTQDGGRTWRVVNPPVGFVFSLSGAAAIIFQAWRVPLRR